MMAPERFRARRPAHAFDVRNMPDRLAMLADPEAMSPEELLIAREEFAANGGEEPEAKGRAPQLTPEEIHALLARLPPEQRDPIVAYLAAGRSQRDIAEELGIAQPSVHFRIKRGIKCMQWIAGPHSWYTPEDVERDLSGTMSADEVLALSIYWRTTSKRAVQTALGMQWTSQSWRLLDGAIRKLSGRYRKGFDELEEWGQYLIDAEIPEMSPLERFLRRRVAFVSDGVAAAATLFAVYEREMMALGRPPLRKALRFVLRSKGIRGRPVRLPWSDVPVWGFRGIRILSARAA